MELKTKLSKKLKSFLTVSAVLFLTACGCFPDAPKIQARQILKRFNKCKVYKAEYNSTLDFTFVGDISLEECLADGGFVITDKELLDLRRTYKEAKDCYNKCKGK